jgi:hypothetical protein
MDGQGNIALSYSVSSDTMFPSIRSTARRASDPPGQLTFAEETIIAGGGSQSMIEGRWGDYSMLAVDPTDDETFWYTNEYFTTTGEMNWRTRIASFKVNTLSDVASRHPPVAPLTAGLSQNYPNPFNPKTTINYQLPASPSGEPTVNRVMLKVFDVLGREVATLVNEVKPARPAGGRPGTHTVQWDASRQASGVYFYKLMAGSFSEVKKLVVLK